MKPIYFKIPKFQLHWKFYLLQLFKLIKKKNKDQLKNMQEGL